MLLAYRNLKASIDKVFLIWQVVFPVVYIFVAGYAYSALIGGQGIKFGDIIVTYPAYLTAGMIGFNVMNSSTVAGSIIWNDKRNGMFQQLLAMPFTKVQYIASNLLTIVLMGLASATLIVVVGLPTMLENINPTFWSIPYTVYALIVGAIFFGSFTIIISTKLKFNVNPLTYIVDISRAGIFSQVTQFTNIQTLIITIVSIVAFLVATISMVKMKI